MNLIIQFKIHILMHTKTDCRQLLYCIWFSSAMSTPPRVIPGHSWIFYIWLSSKLMSAKQLIDSNLLVKPLALCSKLLAYFNHIITSIRHNVLINLVRKVWACVILHSALPSVSSCTFPLKFNLCHLLPDALPHWRFTFTLSTKDQLVISCSECDYWVST